MYADKLEQQLRDDKIAAYLEQVPIRFKCGAVYRVDFVVFERSEMVRFIEVKGVWTATAKLKLRMLQDEHPWIAARLEAA